MSDSTLVINHLDNVLPTLRLFDFVGVNGVAGVEPANLFAIDPQLELPSKLQLDEHRPKTIREVRKLPCPCN